MNIESNSFISSTFIFFSSISTPKSFAISIIFALVTPFKTTSPLAVIKVLSLIAKIFDLLPSVIHPYLSTRIASKAPLYLSF